MDQTRFARVHESLKPLRTDGFTVVQKLRRLPRAFSFQDAFEQEQRKMASAVREQRKPGLFVFAVHEQYGLIARLWLEASAMPRAGVIGRHDFADLALPGDDAISLRHLLFVVRQKADGVHFTALDLETSNGFQLEDESSTRRVESTGPLFLAATQFRFFCIPTGEPLSWNPEAPRSWSTLLPRAGSPRGKERDERKTEPAGRLELTGPSGNVATAVTRGQLERGLLIGRSDRCDVVHPDENVSRVHAVALQQGGEVFLFDSGSTNGIWRGEEEVKATRLRDGDVFVLGDFVHLTWRAAH